MRPVLEQCLKIDLAEPAIRRIFRHANHGELHWGLGDTEVASIAYVWTGGVLILRFNTGGAVHEQRVGIEKTTPNFGGARRWFRCPITNTRVRALILPPNATRWAGRRAHHACYASQNDHRSTRGAWGRLLNDIHRSDARARRSGVRRLRRLERTCGGRVSK
ncbi:MAG: hypothetical protein R3C30_09485 [Hyphomonadaceae bacterium]